MHKSIRLTSHDLQKIWELYQPGTYMGYVNENRIMVKGLVSVVIPSKNRYGFVMEALDSVFAQTYQKLEVIIVDDGSAPSLEHILKSSCYNKILFLRHEESLGASAARNAGARLAKGEYLAFLDDDDLWLPEKIEKQVDAFNSLNDDFGVIYCGFDYLVNGEILSRRNKYENIGWVYPQALCSCPVGSPTALIRKRCFDQSGGFDERLPACEDWDLWVRLSMGCLFFPVKKSLALYRVHGSQLSTDVSKNICFRETFIEQYRDDLQKFPKTLSKHYCRLGSLCRLADRNKESFSFYIKSLQNNLLNFYALAHIFISCISISADKYLTKKYGTMMIGKVRIIN